MSLLLRLPLYRSSEGSGDAYCVGDGRARNSLSLGVAGFAAVPLFAC